MIAPADSRLPEGVLLAFYGDDFTGSTAVMEVMTFNGLPTVLFLDTPSPEHLARFAGYRGIGIAGIARAKNPDWMDRNLPPIFRALAALNAPIAHYKMCSTLDSAPHIGSIGRAIDLAVPILGGAWHPVVVAAPPLARYQAFGNLFAVVGGEGFRLDRHPTMSRHPVTPMGEADVRRHLGEQTARSIGLVDFLTLWRGDGQEALARELERGADIVALDMLDARGMVEAGKLIWEQRGTRLFSIGSQGLEYALTEYWREAGLIAPVTETFRAAPVDRLVVVSGSCSPTTAEQIDWAGAHGFALHQVDVARVVDGDAWEKEIGRAVDFALGALDRGRDPLVYTAAGADDPAVAALHTALSVSGADPEQCNVRIGNGLGKILDSVLRIAGVRRGVIAGGDTSGQGARVLGIHALTAIAPVAPGSPLCKAHSDDTVHGDLEIALKGGQVGAADYFGTVKQGGAA